MKSSLKNVSIILLTIFFILLTPLHLYAASFSITPYSGHIAQGSEFTLDFMIDTDGEETVLARSVVIFDPRFVQVVDAENNDSLYCNYPDDEQSVDNENGVLVLMGFCQSGSDVLYKTVGEPEVYARITFKTIAAEGDVKFSWEYSGEDIPFKSVIMQDGSPPQNILDETPSSVVLTIGEGDDDSGDSTNTGTIPNTGLGLSITVIVTGVILLIIGLFWPKIRSKISFEGMKKRGNKGTVVVYE